MTYFIITKYPNGREHYGLGHANSMYVLDLLQTHVRFDKVNCTYIVYVYDGPNRIAEWNLEEALFHLSL
jgi:hypothetical protein